MTSFEDAIRIGLSSARVADAKVNEIRSIVSEMKNAVQSATQDKISIEIQRRAADPLNTLNLSLALLGKKVKTVDVLFLKRVDTGSEKELARLDIPSEGFPCVVVVGSRRDTCHDGQSLRRALQEVLSAPDAGRALLELMNETTLTDHDVNPEAN